VNDHDRPLRSICRKAASPPGCRTLPFQHQNCRMPAASLTWLTRRESTPPGRRPARISNDDAWSFSRSPFQPEERSSRRSYLRDNSVRVEQFPRVELQYAACRQTLDPTGHGSRPVAPRRSPSAVRQSPAFLISRDASIGVAMGPRDQARRLSYGCAHRQSSASKAWFQRPSTRPMRRETVACGAKRKSLIDKNSSSSAGPIR
jgi:hypothetical protein